MARTKEEIKEYQKKYNETNREILREKRRAYRKTPEAIAKLTAYYQRTLPLKREQETKRRERNIAERLLKSCKQSAALKRLDFNIDISDVTIPEYCPYLKVPITNIVGEGRILTNPSIDRIDSSKGYIKGNVEVISLMANMMKTNATRQQLTEFAREVISRWG